MTLRNLKHIAFVGILTLALGATSFAYADRYDSSKPLPTCSIAITRMSGEGYEKTITLYWTSTNAKHGELHGYGTVGANGAHVVYYPFKDRYTLTVEGDGGKAVCDTKYVTSTTGYTHHDHTQHHIPQYVHLTQIPYTGFDSMIANMMFFATLLLFALAGGYLVVYYLPRLASGKASGGMNRVALAREVSIAANNQLRAVRRTFGF